MIAEFQVLIGLAILPMFVICFYIFTTKKYLVFTHFEFQVLMTGLFMVLVPLDHILMLKIRNNGIFNSLNFEDGGLEVSYDILRVILAFYLFFLGLLIGKSISRRRFKIKYKIVNLSRLQKHIESVPIWPFVILLTAYLVYYIGKDISFLFNNLELSGGSTKQIRLAISETGSIQYKLLAFSANIFFAFNVLLLLSRRITLRLFAFVMIFVLSVYRGDRGDIVLALIVLCVFHRFARPSLIKTTFLVSGLMLFFTSFKPMYNYFFENITGVADAALSSYNFGFYFSRIETLSAFEISNYVLTKYDQAYQFGQSYFFAPLTFIPRFIADFSDLRISRMYKEIIAPGQEGYFGFSPIAEAYVNFGWLGILFIGIIFSFIYSVLELHRLSLVNVLSFFFIFRFFRSDFASSFKMNYFVYGTAMVVSCIILLLFIKLFTVFRQKSSLL